MPWLRPFLPRAGTDGMEPCVAGQSNDPGRIAESADPPFALRGSSAIRISGRARSVTGRTSNESDEEGEADTRRSTDPAAAFPRALLTGSPEAACLDAFSTRIDTASESEPA